MQAEGNTGSVPEECIVQPKYHIDEKGVVRVFIGDRKVGFGTTLNKEEPFFDKFFLYPWAYVVAMNGDIKPYFPWHWCYGKINRWFPFLAPLIFSNEKLEGRHLLQFIADRSKLLTGPEK